MKPVTVGDAELMLAIWNDPAFIRNVTDRGIRTLEQSRDAIKSGAQKLFEGYGYGPYCMSLKSDGSMIGICGLFKRDNLDDPDIGFGVLPDYVGKGYAGEAAQAVVDYARDTLKIGVLTARMGFSLTCLLRCFLPWIHRVANPGLLLLSAITCLPFSREISSWPSWPSW